MRSVRLMALVAVLAVAPAVLAACGGGSSSSKDEDQITAAITKAATSGDPTACTEVQTVKFNEQTAGDGEKGAAATKACEKDAKNSAASSVKVANVKVSGSSATAEAALVGGFVTGQTLNVALVKEGDAWKLDQLTGFAKFDRPAFEKSLLSQTGGDPQAKKAAACLTKRIKSASDQDLQNILLTANGGDKIFTPCFKGQ